MHSCLGKWRYVHHARFLQAILVQALSAYRVGVAVPLHMNDTVCVHIWLCDSAYVCVHKILNKQHIC